LKIIFPTIIDSYKRDVLFKNILLVPYLIPTLHSYFKKLKYFKPCYTIFK
ncbi:hypothetical protein V2W45_1238826, partial [Cenococcum geophilum]